MGPGLKGTSAKGGQASGIKTGRYEFAVNHEFAQRLRDAFLRLGAQVVMTRTEPVSLVTNLERAAIANEAGADIFLRIHCNSSSSGGRGISVHCPLNSDYAKAVADSKTYVRYAQLMAQAMSQATGARAGGKCNDNFVANNWAKMPAFLIELGFMSDPEEDLLLSSPAYQDKLIKGIINGTVLVMKDRGVLDASVDVDQ